MDSRLVIDRRHVLRAGVGIAAAGFAMPSLATPRERWIRPALKVGMIQGGETLAEKLAIARAAGFEGVELDSPGVYSAEDVERAKAETGIEVPGVVLNTHWSKPFNHPDPAVRRDADDALAAALRECAAFGGTSVLVVPAVVNESMPYGPAYQLSQAAMRRAAPLAEELGMQIAFENVWNGFLLSPLESARYSDELNDGLESTVFGWHFDIGNVVNFGWPEQWIDTLGERIIKLDVKDFSRSRRDNEGLWKGFGVKIGDGDAGWERVRDALRRIGYRGWAAAEVQGGDAERLTDIARRIDRVFDQA
jgi:L-ribulose-5-phosphate 3-epimerase